MYRTSLVKEVKINSVASSSFLQAGDTERIQCSSAVLAIQRQSTKYGTFELTFNKYDIFSQEVFTPLCPEVKIKESFHANPFIKVGKIDILGVSSSSIIHLGSVHKMSLQSRVMHIRNFFKNPYLNTEEGSYESVR